MLYQLLMVASPALTEVQRLRDQAEAYGFRKITSVAESETGWSGFCVVYHPIPGRRGDPLAQLLNQWMKSYGAMKRHTRSVYPEGQRLPSDKRLRDEWSGWVKNLPDDVETALVNKRKEFVGMLRDAVDQSISEGSDKAFKIVERQKRQREFERMAEGATNRQKPGSAPALEVTPGQQEIIDKAKKIFVLHKHFSSPLNALEAMSREGIIRDGLPPIAWDALALASTPKEDGAVLELLEKIVATIVRGYEDHQKHNRLALLADADPALFLPFCRPKPLSPDAQRELFDRLQATLAERFFGRTDLVRAVAVNLTRRLAGDPSVLTLLLHGPPGTGKSFLVTQLAEALTEAAIPANEVFQAMTEGGSERGDEALLMQITGTAAHYSNADCGSIFRSTRSREHRLSLVLLDEAEKCHQRDFLVNLLDPRLPLEDSYVKGLVQTVDMRSKTVFFLSANDTSPLCRGLDDPLWSRLQPAWMRPYSREEMEMILMRRVENECPFHPGVKKARSVIKGILDQDGGLSSLRTLLDEVNNALFLLSLDRPELLRPGRDVPVVSPKKQIGFHL